MKNQEPKPITQVVSEAAVSKLLIDDLVIPPGFADVAFSVSIKDGMPTICAYAMVNGVPKVGSIPINGRPIRTVWDSLCKSMAL